MKRGTIVTLMMLVIAITAAGLAIWYHYQNQRQALEFWGPATAQLIDRGDQVELLVLGEPQTNISLGDDTLEPPPAAEVESQHSEPPAARAVEFNQEAWLVADSKDAAGAKGIANLRRALVLDTTFDWAEPGETQRPEPKWQYALSINDGRNWATVLFDFDSHQAGLTGGRETVVLQPEASEDFREFFAEQFPPGSQDEPAEQPAAAAPVEADAVRQGKPPANADKNEDTPE